MSPSSGAASNAPPKSEKGNKESNPQSALASADPWAHRCALFAQSEGFRFFAFGLIVPLEVRRPAQFVLTNYPPEWLRLYDELSYNRVDPVAIRLLTSIMPFAWHDLTGLGPKVDAFWNRASYFGLRYGFTVPVHGPRGQHAALGLSGIDGPVSEIGRIEMYQRTWYFAVGLLEEVLSTYSENVHTSKGTLLTAKQRDALSLVAQGQSIREVGTSLKLHPRTVEYHLRGAAKRLGTSSREQAIVRALLSGDIEEANYPGLLKNWCLRVRAT